MKNINYILIGVVALAMIAFMVTHPPIVPQIPIVVVPPPPIDIEEPTPRPEITTFETALASIIADEARQKLEYLASQELEGRMSGKQGNKTAAAFIKKEYEKFGLETEYQKFPIRRVNPGPKNEQGDDFTQNIFAWIIGSEYPDEIIVIGAHMDHIGYGPSMSRAPGHRAIHPGADDNASGTVALLEIAQAFSKVRHLVKRTVVFQSYSAEEMGLIGSRYYCNNPTFPRGRPDISKHIFMLNLDMVGYLGKGTYFASFVEGESSFDLARIIDELNGKYTFAKRITSRGSGGSDHASFYNKRVPVAFLHTGLHAHYHTPTDTADKINYDGVERVAKYAFELAWRICQDDIKPAFNNAAFKEMPYTHDHGHPEMPFEGKHE